MSAEIYAYDALAKKPPTASTFSETSSSLKPASLLSWLLGSKPTKTVTVPKTAAALHDPKAVDLATLLQYSSAEGHPALREFIRNFVEKVYTPGYADWQIQLNVGTTAGWTQVVNMLLERGDAVLVEVGYRQSSRVDVKRLSLVRDFRNLPIQERSTLGRLWVVNRSRMSLLSCSIYSLVVQLLMLPLVL